MDRWPHQIRAVEDVVAAINDGVRRILLVSPTGGGKTRIALDLADEFTSRGMRVVIYTNRRMLVEQVSRVLDHAGIAHGIRAAGHGADHSALIQVSSIQTENSRVTKRGQWELADAHLVLVDEAHMQTGPTVLRLIGEHVDKGAHVVGLTATPVGLGEYYDQLIQAGTVSELRQCGALAPCLHYGPDEPDLAEWKRSGKLIGLQEGEDLSENQARKVMMTAGIFGRVLEWFLKLNPDRRPTILFAPGVPESLWFAEQFTKEGITAAHIDGSDVWINGTLYRTSPEAREDVINGSRDGRIVVVCNRFVLREGIDAPWLSHGIFATVFGSLQTYLQSGGRLLRAYPNLPSVTIQDHGGNWHRHGSLNADRTWTLDDTAARLTGLRAEELRQRLAPEPQRCQLCGQIIFGQRCPSCNVLVKRGRPVVQCDGTLKILEGRIFRPRSISQKPDGPKIWERMYHRSRTEKGRRTFVAAEALFAMENNWQWPDRRWPFMPRQLHDLFRLVEDVPIDRLIPKPTFGIAVPNGT